MNNKEYLEVKEIMHSVRENKLNDFFDELKIDEEKLKKAKKHKFKLHPKSVKMPLFSTLYRDKKGKFTFEELTNEFYDSILSDGMIVGIEYGKKFIAEDIQKGKLTKEDILTMSDEELEKYYNKERKEI